MTPDGAVAAHHEVGPAQFMLHLLVALLDPVAQAVQPHDMGQRRLLRGQIRRQVPSGYLGSRRTIARRADRPHQLVGAIAKQAQLAGPPALHMTVAKGALDLAPGAGRHLAGRLTQGMRHLLSGPAERGEALPRRANT